MFSLLKRKNKNDADSITSLDKVSLTILQEQIRQIELFIKKYQINTDNKIKKMSAQIAKLEDVNKKTQPKENKK